MSSLTKGQSKHATLRKIAELTATTANTVSRALNDRDGVSEETRALIKKVAAELNYRPDPFARSMRGKHSNLVGFLVEDITNPFFVQMLAGAEQEVMRIGKTLLIGTSNENSQNEQEHINTFLTYRCAGMALCLVAPNKDQIDMLNATNVPYVLLDTPFDMVLHCDHFCIDYRSESIKVTKYLIENGHRRIAYISPDLKTNTEVARYEGFLQALKEKNIPEKESKVVFCKNNNEAYREALNLCKIHTDITAVYIAKSIFGLSVLSALITGGKRIPEDTSVIMFGHTDWADVFQPKITYLRRPVFEMGRLGIERLEKKITNSSHIESERVVMSAQLRFGESVARIGG